MGCDWSNRGVGRLDYPGAPVERVGSGFGVTGGRREGLGVRRTVLVSGFETDSTDPLSPALPWGRLDHAGIERL